MAYLEWIWSNAFVNDQMSIPLVLGRSIADQRPTDQIQMEVAEQSYLHVSVVHCDADTHLTYCLCNTTS